MPLLLLFGLVWLHLFLVLQLMAAATEHWLPDDDDDEAILQQPVQ